MITILTTNELSLTEQLIKKVHCNIHKQTTTSTEENMG